MGLQPTNEKSPFTCHAERRRSICGGPRYSAGDHRYFAALRMTGQGTLLMACHEKVTGTCHSERSEESEVGHAARLVRPDASLPLSMTREGAFFTACQKAVFVMRRPGMPGGRDRW